MFRIYVNGSYVCNTYYKEVTEMLSAQLRSFGWRELFIADRPQDVFFFSDGNKQ